MTDGVGGTAKVKNERRSGEKRVGGRGCGGGLNGQDMAAEEDSSGPLPTGNKAVCGI